MAGVLWLDFEGAVVEPGLTGAVLERAGGSLQAIEGQTREQQMIAAFQGIETPEGALLEACAELARPRDGVAALLDWASWHGWYAAVGGVAPMPFVAQVLDGLGFDRVGRHAGRLRLAYQWRLMFVTPRGVEVEDGFPLSYVSAFQRAGDFVAYVGDDPADAATASQANAVFGGQTLIEAIGGSERRYAAGSLAEVIPILEREGEAWLASLSSTTAAGG